MELIKDFTVGLVVVCIIGAVILILSPEGSAEKTVKTAVSLVMLLCFIYPFCSGKDLKIDFELPVDTEVAIAADELFADTFKSRLVSDISFFLSDNGINAERIEIDMHTSAESEILIESVTVHLSVEDESKQGVVQRLIKDKFGIDSCAEVSNEP